MQKSVYALVCAAAVFPSYASAICFPPTKSSSVREVARDILSSSDVVGIAVLVDGHSELDHDPQRIRLVEMYKGTQQNVLMQGDRLGNGFTFDDSKFFFVPGKRGDIRFVALKIANGKAYVPSCTALAIRSVQLDELIYATKALSR